MSAERGTASPLLPAGPVVPGRKRLDLLYLMRALWPRMRAHGAAVRPHPSAAGGERGDVGGNE
jgi:hypothetical protein